MNSYSFQRKEKTCWEQPLAQFYSIVNSLTHFLPLSNQSKLSKWTAKNDTRWIHSFLICSPFHVYWLGVFRSPSLSKSDDEWSYKSDRIIIWSLIALPVKQIIRLHLHQYQVIRRFRKSFCHTLTLSRLTCSTRSD